MKVKKMSKISVIVPIYNAEAYLNRCLDSIINQTYSDLEIILINDGSTDNSLDICLEYASKDKRIVVYNQTNKGISKTRNKGIELATGDYIGFVDSDDIISPRMYETLYNLMTDEKCLIAGCQYTKFTSSCNFKEDKNYISYTKEEALKKNLNEEISNFLWDKLIKEELFNDFKLKEAESIPSLLDEYIRFFNEERSSYTLNYLTPKQFKGIFTPSK